MANETPTYKLLLEQHTRFAVRMNDDNKRIVQNLYKSVQQQTSNSVK